MELFTGMLAGVADEQGVYPKQTVNGKVQCTCWRSGLRCACSSPVGRAECAIYSPDSRTRQRSLPRASLVSI